MKHFNVVILLATAALLATAIPTPTVPNPTDETTVEESTEEPVAPLSDDVPHTTT